VQAWDGEQALPIGGPRQLKLFTVLVLNAGRAVSADALTDAVWGSSRATSDNRLQMAITRLRRAIAPLAGTGVDLQTVSGGYLLSLAPGTLDAAAFVAAVQAGRRALEAGAAAEAAGVLAGALALWRGPALAEVAFEDFAAAEIRRLDELRLHALESRIEADLQLGRHAALIGELESLLAEDPARERLAGQLMLALYRSGRQGDALEVFHRTRAQLVDTLGLDPGPDLQQLHEAILQQAGSLTWSEPRPAEAPQPIRTAPRPQPARHNLPAVRTSFVNRKSEVAAIEGRMEADRVVTLVGVGGVGKTRLALELAERSLERWPDGAWLVELAAVDQPSAVVEAVAGTLGLEVLPDSTPEDAIARRLEEQHLLLVLDNCEHVLGACAALAARIARGRSPSRVLATSRAPLAVAGESVVRITPLPVPAASVDPAELEDLHAVQLFIERARRARPEFTSEGSELAAIGGLCRALDGIPLGIELVASRVRAMSATEILAHLGNRLSLAGYERDRAERHRDLETTIRWSYDLLSDRQREVFRRLCLFPAPFTLAAAERVLEGADVAQAILDLVDDSILVVAEGPHGHRYRILDTIRDFGLERLAESGEEADASARYLAWAVEFIDVAATEVETRGRTTVLALVEAEYRNLVRALATGGDTTLRLRLAYNLTALLFAGTSLRELRRLLQDALDAAGDANTPAVRLARLWLGRTLCKLGELDTARAHLAVSAEYAIDAQDRVMAAAVATDRALVEIKAGRVAEAQRFLDDAEELGADLDHRVWSYKLLVEAQMRYILLGELERARGLYQLCIKHVRSHGPATVLIAALAALAELEVDLDDPDSVQACAREVLAIADPVADAYSRGGALLALGRAALRAGNPAEATRWLAEAATSDVRRGSMETPETLESLAAAFASDRRAPDAATLLGAAAGLRDRLGLPPFGPEQSYIDDALAAVDEALSDADVQRCLADGRELSERELLALIGRA
jgi:predicted ATPase/DNA-binding SARP family transcriptional activator